MKPGIGFARDESRIGGVRRLRTKARMLAAQALGVVGAIVFFFGCSILVPGDNDRIPCELTPGRNDPCIINGQQCRKGFCQDCLAEEEAPFCDQLDNDCDGAVDENVDRDDDQYERCAAIAAERDCEDDDAEIRPGAPERCNARDDDCDGALDESSCQQGEVCRVSTMATTCVRQRCDERPEPQCEPGLTCMPTSGECEIPVIPCGSCADDYVCDVATDTCVRLDVALGGDCNSDEECASGLCVPRGGLRLPFGGDSIGICGQSCCANSDCNALDETCWVPGTGARTCLPRQIFDNASPIPGGACAHDGDCSSMECAYRSVPLGNDQLSTFVCVDDAPRTVLGCGDQRDQCSSGVCSEQPQQLFYCTHSCATTEDCSGTEGLYPFPLSALFGAIPVQTRCGYERLKNANGQAVDWVQLCIPRDEPSRVHGAECAQHYQCQDRYCDPETHVCRKTCCADRDCARSEQCAAYNVGEHWEMHCGPRTEPRRLSN